MKPIPFSFARFKAIEQVALAGSWDIRKCVRDDGRPKDAWPTREAAQKAAERVRQAPGFISKPGEDLIAYRCPVCTHWHTGNIPTPRGGR